MVPVTLYLLIAAFIAPAPAFPRGVPVAADQNLQLQKCREGILDPLARPEERKRWIELLFSNDTPQAAAMVVEILSLSSKPDCQRAVSLAIAERARTDPHLLDPSFIEPLLNLLGHESEDLRSAASKALADFPSADLPDRLGQLAAQPQTKQVERLAAIDALSPNVHQREVVRQLLLLDKLGIQEVSARVQSALEPLTPKSAADWRVWWAGRVAMEPAAWLQEQLVLHRDRARRVSAELESLRAETEREQGAVIKRTSEFQREILRPLTPDQRDARVVEWIEDSLVTVKLGAFAIVRSRIADDGRRPEGEVRSAILRQLKHDSTIVRRETLALAANLSDPVVVEAILARLEEEPLLTRPLVLQSLGRLASPQVIPALAREIASPQTNPDCLREAALALALIAGKPEARELLPPLVNDLVERYRATPSEHVAVRGALLSAMAAVGHPTYAQDFLGALTSSDPGILQSALRGLKTIGEGGALGQCRELVAHPDTRVRLAAIEAVGRLGRDDLDLEAILNRLSPGIESNDPNRIGAWRAFRELLSRRPVADRVRAAERLRETPELHEKYLEELANVLSMSPANSAELETVRERLSNVLVTAGKFSDAVPHLRELYEMRFACSDGTAAAIGIRWLETTLKSLSHKGLGEVITRLAEGCDDAATKSRIMQTVSQFLESPGSSQDAERSRKLVAELQSVPSDLMGESWGLMVRNFAARQHARDSGASAEPSR